MNRIEGAYIPRGKGTGDNTDKPTGNNPNSHSIKYVCPCCGNSVRATKVVRIKCADCDMMMIAKGKIPGAKKPPVFVSKFGPQAASFALMVNTSNDELTYLR